MIQMALILAGSKWRIFIGIGTIRSRVVSSSPPFFALMPPKPEIRRLLKQQRSERQKEKRVEHPFAKYNEQDQLVCVVCSQVVKSAWPVHLTSSTHKQSIARLKAVKQQQQQQSLKRSAPEEPPVSSSKRPRQEEEEDDVMAEEDTSNQLPADFFDNAPGDATVNEHEDEEQQETSVQEQQQQPTTNNDDQHEVAHQMEHNLPQGFFDNPDEEARARREAPPAEQLENRIEQDYAEFQQLMADTAIEADKAQDVEDEELWQDRDDDIFRQQAVLDERVAKLKAMRERGLRPSAAMAVDDDEENEQGTSTATETVAYDANEKAIRDQMKTGVRKLLQKSSNKAAQSIFDDMDESDEDEDEEDDWRAQQL